MSYKSLSYDEIFAKSFGNSAPEDVPATSLSNLSEHDWQILSNTCARGCDWYIRKVGRYFVPIDAFGKFPLFKTKREAIDAADTLLLWEARHRAIQRNKVATSGSASE